MSKVQGDHQHVPFATVIASCVHDMKNSLGLVIQSVEDLGNTLALDKEQQQQLVHLHYEANRLNSNLIQLLALYRYEQQNLPLNIENHYLLDMVEDLLAKNYAYIDANQITVENQIDEDYNWFFDYNLISGLLNDIFVNMLRYTDSQLRISSAIEDQKLVLTLEDNGEGYPPTMLNGGPDSSVHFDINSGRTGLGLHFAELIAHAHTHNDQQGAILIDNDSALGGGRFRLVLP